MPDARPSPTRRARRRGIAATVLVHALLALAAWVPADAARVAARRAAAPAARTLHVTATEFAFLAPDTVSAGRVRVRMTSRGAEPHILMIARMTNGQDARAVLAEMAARRAPEGLVHVGGPGVPPTGGASEVTIDLAPGRYLLYCPIASASDHATHMSKGMFRVLTVTPAASPAGPPAGAPAASRAVREDGHVVLDDYAFSFASLPRAGRLVLRVENRAAQPHEFIVYRLAPGKRAEDVVRWARNPVGAAPGAPAGGTTAIAPGAVVHAAVTLARGRYALLCFVPDQADGRSHVAHGMIREIEVP